MIDHKKINYFSLIIVLSILFSCSRSLELVNSSNVTNTIKPKPQKIWSWTKESKPFYVDQNIDAVDTIVYSYDSLYRLEFIYQIVDLQGKDYWSNDSLRFVYQDAQDSVDHQIEYSTYKNGDLRSDTTFFIRDSMGRVIHESSKFIHDDFYNSYTSYIYNIKGDPISKTVTNEVGAIKKKTLWTYLSSDRRTIEQSIIYKSGGLESFRTVDTIDISIDSLITKISDYSTNYHGNKYLNSERCANCIEVFKENECGKIDEKTRIVRPNDTIFHELILFDAYCSPVKWTTRTKKGIHVSTSTITRDKYGYPIMMIDSTDGVYTGTTWRDYLFWGS